MMRKKTLKKACVCGHFGFGANLLNGQTVKTKIIAEELERSFGADQVWKLDTHGGARALLRLPFQLCRALRSCANIVILPAHRGVRVIVPMLTFLNCFYRRRLHYAVIGGWLPTFLEDQKRLTAQLKRFDGIYPETVTMCIALEKKGFENLHVMPNCKELTLLAPSELVLDATEPYRLCTFSRVMREKGIEDAVNAVRAVNQRSGRTVYTLDIYGQVDADQVAWFEALRASFPDEVRYGGEVPFDRSVEVLKSYFALLFPTKFYTEGIPGTILDAYAAGIPVISSRWESFSDLIEEGRTGIGYAFDYSEGLYEALCALAQHPQTVFAMKAECLRKAQDYLPSRALSVLVREMEDLTEETNR